MVSLPDVCSGDVGHHDQGTEVDPLTQLLLPSGPGEVVGLVPGITSQVSGARFNRQKRDCAAPYAGPA